MSAGISPRYVDPHPPVAKVRLADLTVKRYDQERRAKQGKTTVVQETEGAAVAAEPRRVEVALLDGVKEAEMLAETAA